MANKHYQKLQAQVLFENQPLDRKDLIEATNYLYHLEALAARAYREWLKTPPSTEPEQIDQLHTMRELRDLMGDRIKELEKMGLICQKYGATNEARVLLGRSASVSPTATDTDQPVMFGLSAKTRPRPPSAP